ncbi:hypothetical protein [Kribbella sp.]|uniref:hypothetical protein n=1 Tax=Kribbella sp. TaxID=1871183 RepID=UPI002D285D66|nr:hypothetical protein [Kribbella sp.]HZX02884.1 hypothetical protein [Kribbella sp.]
MKLTVTVEAADGSPIETEPDWRIYLARTPAGPSEESVRLRAQYIGAAATDARVRLEVAVPDGPPRWLIPGLFYGANRDPACERIYPRYEPGAQDRETLTADCWAFRADRAATPAVFAWGNDGGVALSVAANTALGLSGLGLGAGPDHPATIWISLPYREEPFSYVGEPHGVDPLAESHRWHPGESHEIQVGLWTLPPDRHSYAPVLSTLRDRSARPPVVPWVDLRQAAELTAYGLWRWHYREDPAVLIETALFDRELVGDLGGRGDRLAMHVAWVSGIPYAYALLRHGRRVGNPAYVDAGTAVIDHITANLTPAGTFFGTWYAEHGWSGSWTPVPGGLHARTLAEATLFAIRALAAEPDHPAWRTAVLSNLEFALTAQEADGNFGSLYHLETGEVLSRRGAAGLTWVGAMAAAYELFGDDRFREAARRGGRYYATFVRDESLCGAPEDVDLAPTCEDGYAALLAYLGLHRIDPSDEWLDLARTAADWMLTFRYSYDVQFAPETLLATYGFRSRGGDQASPSNQHLHNYGLICTAELVTLSALTGDAGYARSAVEHLRFARQFVARHDGDFNARRGMVTERYYQTRCFGPPGAILTLSHSWCVGMLLLASEEALALPDVDW